MKNKVIEVISEVSGVPTGEIEENHSLLEDLDMDDIDVLELVIVLEAELYVALKNDEEENWKTVKDVIETIENL